MPTYGFTAEGLKIKRLADILDDLRSDALTTFGSSVDLDARRPLGQFIGIQAERFSLIWELIEQLNNATSPRHASGKQFDEILALNGLIRRRATFSTVDIKVTGDEGTIVEATSRVSVSDNPEAIFEVDTDIVIAAGLNAAQKLTFLSVPSDGNFTLILDGQVTTPLDQSADAIDVEDALKALPNVTDVEVTGNFGSGFAIEFVGDDGQRPWPMIQVGSNTLVANSVLGLVFPDLGDLDGKSFRFDDPGGAVGVYFDFDDSGAPAPMGLAGVTYRQIRIATIDSADADPVIASKFAAEMELDSAIQSATIPFGNAIQLTLAAEQNLQALVDIDTGGAFTQVVIGRDIGELTITPSQLQAGVLPTGTGSATASIAGPIRAPAGLLTVIQDSISGWDSVTNPLDAEEGDPLETDAEAKARRISQFATAGRSVPSAIKSKLLDVPDVESAAVRYNNKNTTVNGLPPKSVKAYVLGGTDEDIAAMLFDSVAAGIETVGDIEVEHIDDDGFPQIISFSRPTLIPVYVTIVVEKNPEDTWPTTATTALKQAVVDYGDTLAMGDDVIPYPRLMSFLNILPSLIQGMELTIGLAASPTGDDRIEIAPEALAVFDTSRVVVTIQNLS